MQTHRFVILMSRKYVENVDKNTSHDNDEFKQLRQLQDTGKKIQRT